MSKQDKTLFSGVFGPFFLAPTNPELNYWKQNLPATKEKVSVARLTTSGAAEEWPIGTGLSTPIKSHYYVLTADDTALNDATKIRTKAQDRSPASVYADHGGNIIPASIHAEVP